MSSALISLQFADTGIYIFYCLLLGHPKEGLYNSAEQKNSVRCPDMDKGFHRVTAGELLNKVQIAQKIH